MSAMLPQVRTIDPERGRILSADGHLLAASVPRFDLHWDPTVIDTKEETQEFLSALPELAQALATEFGGKSAQGWRNLPRGCPPLRQEPLCAPLPVTSNGTGAKRCSPFPGSGDRSRNRSGFMFSEKPRRDKPFSPLANRTIGLHRPNGGQRGH